MKKISLIIVLTSLLFIGKAQESDSLASLKIDLSIDKELKFKKIYGEQYLFGQIKISIKNNSQMPYSLVKMDEHNLLFIDTINNLKYIPFHVCRSAGFRHGETDILTILPGKTQSLIIDSWDCSGGPFKLPPKGNYMLVYRILSQNNLESIPEYKKLLSKNYKSMKDEIFDAEELLKSDSFWSKAFYSDSINIKLK